MNIMQIVSALISALMVALIAAIGTTATNDVLPCGLSFALRANATDVLANHGLWAPNLTAFAQGEPNIAGVDANAEAKKLIESGINITDLIDVRYGGVSSVAVKEEQTDCQRCTICHYACVALLFLAPM